MTPLISYILPCFKKFSMFIKTVPYNFDFLNPDAEVVMVLDEPSEEHLYFDFIMGYASHLMRVKLIVNDEPHNWRPPCIPINVGIRHASGDWCVVMSPETVLTTPSHSHLNVAARCYAHDKVYFTGILSNIKTEELTWDGIRNPSAKDRQVGFGFVMFKRVHAMEIGGYDERRLHYGQDDDDVRNRLKKFGCRNVQMKEVRALHLEHAYGPLRMPNTLDEMAETAVLPNAGTMGLEFNRVAYDWKYE